MKITPDTAILVRSNAKATGPARELLSVIETKGEQLILSEILLAEVARVLRYPRMQALYGLNEEDISEHLLYIKSLGEVFMPAEGPPIVLKDPDDDPIVYTAVAGGADVICTVDRHFYEPDVLAFCARRGILVVSDVDLLHALRAAP